MTSWKTSLFGLITAVGLAIQNGAAGAPSPLWQKLSMIFQVIGAAGIGFSAKDSNVTGGTKPATQEAVTRSTSPTV